MAEHDKIAQEDSSTDDKKHTFDIKPQDVAQAAEEWIAMIKGTVEYQQQQLFRNVGDLPGTIKRKINETVDQFIDSKNVEDNRYKKVAHRVLGALSSRDIKSAFRALRDLLP